MRLFRGLTALAGLLLAGAPASAATFTNGEFVTYTQLFYGTFNGETEDPALDALLASNWSTLFGPSDLLQVGGPPGYSLIFDSDDAVVAYLPAGGTPGPLTVTLLDPVTSSSGALGGEVVTATLNVTLSDAGLLAHPPGIPLGDLVFRNLDTLVGDIAFAGQTVPFGPEIAALDGMSVREVLSDADLLLGGDPSPFTGYEMLDVLEFTDQAFTEGMVGTYAEYLALPPAPPPPVPEPPGWAVLLVGVAGLGMAGRGSRSQAPMA